MWSYINVTHAHDLHIYINEYRQTISLWAWDLRANQLSSDLPWLTWAELKPNWSC